MSETHILDTRSYEVCRSGVQEPYWDTGPRLQRGTYLLAMKSTLVVRRLEEEKENRHSKFGIKEETICY